MADETDPPFLQPPDVTLPDAASMVGFTGNESNRNLQDEIDEHGAAIPAVRRPELSLDDMGLRE